MTGGVAVQGLARSLAVLRRNATAGRHFAYWWVLVSGFVEPLVYLLSIGFGVGALLGAGRPAATYAAFVAPAMLAALSMQAALAETFNFFIKMRYMRLYDAVLATPVTPVELAGGELLWATLRGAAYAATFLAVMLGLGLTTPGRALAAFPAALLVGFAFGGVGMMLATFLRGSTDFDYVTVVQVALFLFSGTFAPLASYPPVVRVIVELTPLSHAVALLRALTTGEVGPAALWHLGYLLALAAVGLTVAGRRMHRLLRS